MRNRAAPAGRGGRGGSPIRVGIDLRILQGPGAIQGIGTYLGSLAGALFRATDGGGGPFEIVPFCLAGKPFIRPPSTAAPPGRATLLRPAREIRVLTDALNQLLTPIEILAGRVALFHAPSPYDLCFFYPARLVVTVHDLAPLAHPEWVVRTGLQHAFLYRFLRRAVRIIAVSEFTRGEIVSRLRIPPARIDVVHEAPAASFRAPPDPARARETARRLGAREPFVLFVAGFRLDDPRKNALGVVEAFVRLTASRPALTLVIAGALGPGAEPARRRIRDLGIEARVLWTGFLSDEDLADLYAACALFLFPSRYEGFGLPVLEAIACGAPVVTTRAGAIPEVAGEAALYADPEDPDETASRAAEILDSPTLASRLGEEGRSRARGYSWERAARETLAVYARALSLPEGSA